MKVLFIRLDPATALEAGSKYFVKDEKEAALLVASIMNSTPNPAVVITNYFNIDFQTKSITENTLPKVIFSI